MRNIFAKELYNKLYIHCNDDEKALVDKRLYEYVH